MTPEEAAEFLRGAAARVHEELVGVAEVVTQGAQLLAVGYLGHQQASWLPLSSATIFGFRHAAGFWIKGKAELGFAGPDYDPLLRTGELGQSYETEVSDEAGLIVGALGSRDKVALYQEMGTPNARYPIPARPALALGMQEMIPVAEELLEETLIALLTPD